MDCRHIEEKLPAYHEGVLPPDEGKIVEEHVAACPNCRRALEDLVKADRLIRDLEEAEPPPWLKQKIMARVREERERREGFFRTLFYPLHIKIPATALATVLIAVFAVYVFRAVEPETRYLHQAPSAPVTPEKKIAEPPVVPAPKAAVRAVPGDRERLAVSETDREGGGKPVSTEEKETLPGPAKQAAAERKISERMDAAPAAPAATRMQKAPLAKGALPPAEKGETGFGAAMKDEVRAPAVAAKVKTEAPEGPGYTFALYVKDPATAVNDVESLLAGYGARKITKEFRDGRGLITAEVESGKTKEIFQRLKSLGEVRDKGKVAEYTSGPVSMKIEVFTGP